jgi:hypothetical protein
LGRFRTEGAEVVIARSTAAGVKAAGALFRFRFISLLMTCPDLSFAMAYYHATSRLTNRDVSGMLHIRLDSAPY